MFKEVTGLIMETETTEQFIRRMEIESMTPEQYGDMIVDEFLEKIDNIITRRERN
jgi:hypothetical protein